MSDGLLDGLQFGPVAILDLFDSMKASRAWYDKVHLKPGEGENIYLSQTLNGNSVAGVVADQDVSPEPGNCITVTLKTQATFYQPAPFYSAQNFLIFRHSELDDFTGLVLVAAMRKVFEKFSWGYGISMTRLARMHVVIPVRDEEGEDVVDWDGMRSLGRSLKGRVADRGLAERMDTNPAEVCLDSLTFGTRYIVDLFNPHKGKRLIQAHRVDGDTPFVGGSAFHNSITGFSRVDPLFPGGWLSLVYNGSVGRTRYQPAAFYASDDVIALEPLCDAAGENALIFCAALIEKVCVNKFSYGIKLNLQRLKRTKIPVPVRVENSGEEVVDWQGMEAVGAWMHAAADVGARHALAGRELVTS